jgi:hypothetical protein
MYQYHQGPIYTNGALELVFDKQWEYPIVVMKGAGQIAGQWSTRQSPQMRVQIALTPVTLEGAGVRAGQINPQYLVDTDPNAAIGVM